jgi:hypothetical protein
MNSGLTNKSIRLGVMIPTLAFCLVAAQAPAQSAPASAPGLPSETLQLMANEAVGAESGPDSFTLMLDRGAGLDFDLGGSETRKLQLQLARPLSLTTGSNVRTLDDGGSLLGLDATLDIPLSNGFSLEAGVDKQIGQARFQSLGSIQCMNGVLRADSYTASGCRFVNEPLATSDRQRIDLGARMDLGNASASINWFTQESGISQSNVSRVNTTPGQFVMADSLLSPNLGNPLLSNPGSDPLQYLNSEASGVNLNFKVGYATDTSGDLRLGLAFSRVLDADYQGIFSSGSQALAWTLAEPFNTARMNLEWSKGSFSSGIQGYYRDSMDFLDRNSLDSLTTFDVHFTWRTPWNANLSVGASNVLNAGAENPSKTDSQPVDPLESIYGRIPYVRYKQDL